MGVGEGGRLVGHEAGESVAIEGRTVGHAIRMPGRDVRCAVIPRCGSVDVADEAADVAGRRAGLGIEVEQAGAAIGAAEEAAVRSRGEATGGACAERPRRVRSRTLWWIRVIMVCWFLCFLARLDRGMSDRLRRCGGARILAETPVLMCLSAGPGAWCWSLEPGRRVGRVPEEYRSPVRFRQTAEGHGWPAGHDGAAASGALRGPSLLAMPPKDSGLFTEPWLILPPSTRQTRGRPGAHMPRARDPASTPKMTPAPLPSSRRYIPCQWPGPFDRAP